MVNLLPPNSKTAKDKSWLALTDGVERPRGRCALSVDGLRFHNPPCPPTETPRRLSRLPPSKGRIPRGRKTNGDDRVRRWDLAMGGPSSDRP